MTLCRSTDGLVIGAVILAAIMAADLRPGPGQELPRLGGLLAQQISVGRILVLVASVLAWHRVFGLVGLYDAGRPTGRLREALAVAAACGLGTLGLQLPLLRPFIPGLTLGDAIQLWGTSTFAAVAARLAIRRFVATPRGRPRNVVIVGSGPRALRFYRQMADDPQSRYHVVGFVDDVFDSGQRVAFPVSQRALGTTSDFENILMRSVVDEVLVALPVRSQYEQIQRAIDACARVGVECRYPVDVFQARRARARVEPQDDGVAVRLPVAADDARLVAKRAIDAVGAAVGLVLLAPLFAVTAVAVRLSSPGPVFFAQDRYGYRKRLFRMYKFRTMVHDAEALQPLFEAQNEAQGPVFKIRRDPRLTAVGAFLRASSIDELPQLFNVLRGDMSLVGPRPMAVRDVGRFTEPWLMRRFSVPPGITCLWQASGRSDLTFDDWIALDLEYIDNWSLWADFKILLQTVPAVLRGRGAR